MRKVFLFLVPIGLWAFCLQDFLSLVIPVNMDTNTIYGVTKYYFNNLFNGVIPLWEPFVNLGRPFYAISICNLFNPVTQLVPLLKLVGLNYQMAFNVYIIAYFLLATFGFYALCCRLLKNSFVAYLGFIGFLFSSVGVSIFNQVTLLEIITPCLWLMFFVIGFNRKPSYTEALGVVYCLMVILSSYLPFYSLLWMCVMGSVIACFKPQQLAKSWVTAWHWLWKNKIFCVSAFVVLMIAASPLLMYKIIDSSGDVVAPGRHCQYVDNQTCIERTLNDAGGMQYDEITRSGTIGERIDVGYLFTHLDKLSYGSDSLFFLPVFFYFLFFYSLFRRVNRTALIFFVSAFVLWLFAQGAQGPLHKIAYEYLFFMKYFRNLFFLGIFSLSLFLIGVLIQLESWFENTSQSLTQRKANGVAILFSACCVGAVLFQSSGVDASVWWTLILSTLCLMLLQSPWRNLLLGKFRIMWVIIILISPVAVIVQYSKNAREFSATLPHSHSIPSFSWIRPQESAVNENRIYKFVPYEDFYYAMSMTDAPAQVGYPQSASRWSFMLSQKIGDEALKQYAQYKFVIYDDPPGLTGQPITDKGQGIEIEKFTVNEIIFKTNFSTPKFVIYNDSYSQYWKATLDGKKVQLEIANVAFKGIRLNAGKHHVRMVYQPPGGGWIYILTTIVLMIVFMSLLWMWRKRL